MKKRDIEETLAEAARERARRVSSEPEAEPDDALLARYRVGLLSPETSAEVERQLAASPSARARLAAVARDQVSRRSRRRRLVAGIGGAALVAAAAAWLLLPAPLAPPRYAIERAEQGLLFDPELRYRGANPLPPIALAPGEDLLLRGIARGARADEVRLLVLRLGELRPIDAELRVGPDGSFTLRASGAQLLGARASVQIVLVLERRRGDETAETRFRTQVTRRGDG